MKKTRNAFLLSLTALVLCVAMMTGTTFAWFTDTETNTGNKIRAGVLDIQLWQKTSTLSADQLSDTNLRNVDVAKFADKFPSASDYKDISKSSVPIMDYELWEPGYKTPAGSFAIANNGNLALIYTYKLNATRSITGLQHYSETNNGATNTDRYNHLMKNNCNSYLDDIIEVYDETGTTKICDFKDMDSLTSTSLKGTLLPGEVKVTSGFVLKMPEDAGNEYEYAEITLDIVVEAYQKDYEKDGFGSDQYDVTADPKYVAPTTPTNTTPTNTKLDQNPPVIISVSDFYDDNDKEQTITIIVDNNISGHGNLEYAVVLNPTNTDLVWSTSNKVMTKAPNTLHYCFVRFAGDDNYNPSVSSAFLYETGSCFAKGTKVTMYDGSLKNIEDIAVGDLVLTYDHESANYEPQEILIAYKGSNTKQYFTLNFSNGNNISIIGTHDLFEKESLKYVPISINNAENFIGHHFYDSNENSFVELLSVTYSKEPIEYYCLYTKYNYNCIANGMLTVPDDADMYLNIYEFNNDLSINKDILAKDIETYGYYDYSEDCLLTEQEFDEAKAKYVNIIVGKGLSTLEKLFSNRDEFINS